MDQILTSSATDVVTIRGRQLALNELVDGRLFDESYLEECHQQLLQGKPFPFLVADGWFNATLLELVHEEFDLYRASNWKTVLTDRELTHRSHAETMFGPATQIYFGIINSGWFVRSLSKITGVEDLIVDPQFYGGGLHETRNGGHFGVHRDFDRHLRTGLQNQMVLITYLNRDWQPEWHGALELWDKSKKNCVAKVEPEFGRTLILPHGQHSYHGHPTKLDCPEPLTRRSVAAYFYTNPYAEIDRDLRQTSRFLGRKDSKKEFLRKTIRPLTPPIVWTWMARVLKL